MLMLVCTGTVHKGELKQGVSCGQFHPRLMLLRPFACVAPVAPACKRPMYSALGSDGGVILMTAGHGKPHMPLVLNL